MQSKKFLSSLHFSKAISIFSESPPEHIGHTFGNRHFVKLRPLALSHVMPDFRLGNFSGFKGGNRLCIAEINLLYGSAAPCHFFPPKKKLQKSTQSSGAALFPKRPQEQSSPVWATSLLFFKVSFLKLYIYILHFFTTLSIKKC